MDISAFIVVTMVLISMTSDQEHEMHLLTESPTLPAVQEPDVFFFVFLLSGFHMAMFPNKLRGLIFIPVNTRERHSAKQPFFGIFLTFCRMS